MKKMLIGAVAGVAMLAGAASPAAARGYWGGPRWGGGYYRHGGGDAFGNFLLGAVIAGGAVAIATSAGKNRADDRPEVRSNGRFDVNAAGEDAREVASICSEAAESMARGRVLGVDSVGRDGDGWRVEGVVDADLGQRHFSCGARSGRVDFVQFAER